MPTPKNVHGRKLLVAAIGVASVSYVACGKSPAAGNLATAPDAPPVAPIVGNMPAPPPLDASTTPQAVSDAAVKDAAKK